MILIPTIVVFSCFCLTTVSISSWIALMMLNCRSVLAKILCVGGHPCNSCDTLLYSFQGILLKGGHVLDALASCHTIAFDKTGTLTTGGLVFKAIEPIFGHFVGNNRSNFASCCIPNCEKEALAVAAAMEKGTTHPIGR